MRCTAKYSACPSSSGGGRDGVGKLLSDGAERKGLRHGKDSEGVRKDKVQVGGPLK